jgi:hypothetical protein
MSKRWVPVLLAGAVFFAGLALADEPAGPDEPPVRLKKKKPKDGDQPKTEPGNKDEKKKDDKKDTKKDDQREAEPVTPQEEEKEVLQRVVKNVQRVEDRLAKNDLGEATQQSQRDILKDLESLIKRNEESPDGGGGGGEDNNPMDNQDNKDKQGKAGQQSNSKQNGGAKQSNGSIFGKRKVTKSQRRPGSGKKKQRAKSNGGQNDGDKQPGGKNGNGQQSGGKNGTGGNGGGGDRKNPERNHNADLDKKFEQWGHLPPSLRAQMDAFSNPQPFLPKYDELIKRYYRTIAEKGRRKGE